jgi:hypothetical protein
MSQVRIRFGSGAGELLIVEHFAAFALSKEERDFIARLADHLAQFRDAELARQAQAEKKEEKQ